MDNEFRDTTFGGVLGVGVIRGEVDAEPQAPLGASPRVRVAGCAAFGSDLRRSRSAKRRKAKSEGDLAKKVRMLPFGWEGD